MSLTESTRDRGTRHTGHARAAQPHPVHMKRFALLLCICMFAVACSKGDVANGDGRAADASAKPMAAMPGMAPDSASSTGAMPANITLSAAQIQHGGVRWAPVAMTTAAAAAAVPGQIVPDEDRTARLGTPARGRVLSVHVQAGDRVSAGQALVTLESTDAGMAQADVAKAAAELSSRRAQAEYARSARDRAERLLALKAIPRQDYERAIADNELAQSSLAGAQAELRRARSTAAQLGAASSTSGEIVIRSPMRGVVLARTAVPGAVVDAGAPMVVVTDPAILWLTIDAPEQFAALFRVNDRLRFEVPAYPAATFVARVASIGAGLDPNTRTLPVRGVVANTDARLKPEMLANVLVSGGDAAPAVILPDDAVQLLENTPTVFLARPDGKGGAAFTRRAVEILSRTGGHVAISKGLAPGDIVVSAGAFAVKAEFTRGSMPKMEM